MEQTSKLVMESMEFGNTMYAELDGRAYVGAGEKEWCEVSVQVDEKNGAQRSYAAVTDASLLRRLYTKSIEVNFSGPLDSIVAKHLAKKVTAKLPAPPAGSGAGARGGKK